MDGGTALVGSEAVLHRRLHALEVTGTVVFEIALAVGDLGAEIEAYLKTGIDGLFSDNPREAVPAVKAGATQ